MSSSCGFSKKIITLSQHSFTEHNRTDRKGRKFSNINTQAVIYNNEHLQQLYTGLYLDENLHNVGSYRWLSDKGSHKYEGKLFLNHLHGYGKLLYADDSLYEGLFYFNKKFGPGVITYENKRQDVGLWNGNYLIRLCDKFSVSNYYKEHIPKLSGLIQSKLYLLQFKRLIPISEKYKDSAKDILIKLGASEKVLANKNVLYSKLVRHPKSIFVNEEKYYKNFFTYEDELYTTIDVVDHVDENGKPVIIKLDMCNLVAWNNEEINTVILKHAFLNRHYEKLLSFKINDILCTKSRGNFLPPGPVEANSQGLLFACRADEPGAVRKLITENDLYPDVADCRGNNTVTYATLANQTNIIKVLSEFGANLNNFNDDCITPLMFAILHYIAIKFNITGSLWEAAFIYSKAENDLSACNQQWPLDSTILVDNISDKDSQESFDRLSATSKPSDTEFNNETFQNDVARDMERRDSLTSLFKEYIFSLDCVRSKRVNIRKTVDMDMKIRKSVDIVQSDLGYNRYRISEIKKISKTISTLLLCGANPNIGEVPFCPIITSIFSKSKDLIQMLIGFNAFVNAKTCEYFGNLGPLHVIGSLSPCEEQLEMALVFLENGAYVDDLSNKIHWLEEQSILLADKAPQDCLEKTPLHLVCMRYDFLDDPYGYLIELALMFIQYGANLNLKYLGHTPLTLAMMRGNTKLMQVLLETGLIDPNQGLGYNMGVPLTMCVLNCYSKLLHSSTIKQLYSILMEFYANPFNAVPNFNGNAIEFYYSQQKIQASTKRVSITKTSAGYLLLNYAKTTLLRYIQSKVVQTLYKFKIECDLDSTLYNAIVKYLNYAETLDILQILIDHNEIVENEINIQKLLNYVSRKETNKNKKFTSIEGNYKKFHFKNFMPELDPDEEKFKVCFECFKKTKKRLILCPKCEMIYFCSQECNKKNSKDPNSGHPCKGVFYENEQFYGQYNQKRSTKFEDLIRKTIDLQNLLSFANMDMEEFGKMTTKDKKKSIAELKVKQTKYEKKIKKGADVDKTSSTGVSDSRAKSFNQSPDHKTRGQIRKNKLNAATSVSGEIIHKDKNVKPKKSTTKDIIEKMDKSAPEHKDVKSEKSSVINEDTGKNLENDSIKKAENEQMKSGQNQESKLLKSNMPEREEEEEKHDDDEDDYDDDEEPRTSEDHESPKRSKGLEQNKISKEKMLPNRNVTFSFNEISSGVNRSKYSSKKQSSRSKTSTNKNLSKTESSAKQSSRSKPTTNTDFGENKYNKVNLNINKKASKAASSVKHGLSILIGSKKPVIDVEKRNMYLKLRAQMLERDRELNARKNATVQSQCFTKKLKLDKNCTGYMLQLARERIPKLPTDYEELDVKFWQIFSPYCIFQDGQLYYNFNDDNNDVFYKVTYSTV